MHVEKYYHINLADYHENEWLLMKILSGSGTSLRLDGWESCAVGFTKGDLVIEVDITGRITGLVGKDFVEVLNTIRPSEVIAVANKYLE